MGQIVDVTFDDGTKGVIAKQAFVAAADGSMTPPMKVALIWGTVEPSMVVLLAQNGFYTSSRIDSATLTLNDETVTLKEHFEAGTVTGSQSFLVPLASIVAIGSANNATLSLTSGEKTSIGDLLKASTGNVVLKEGLPTFLSLIANRNSAATAADFSSLSKDVTSGWEPLIAGSTIKVNQDHGRYPFVYMLSNGGQLDGKLWTGQLKNYVESLPVGSRGAVIEALSRCDVSYDEFEDAFRFEPSDRTAQHTAIRGIVGKSKAVAFLKIQYRSDDWIFWDSFSLISDGYRYDSHKIEVSRENSGGTIWEYANLSLSDPKIMDLATRIARSDRSVIRFHGGKSFSDFEIPGEQKAQMVRVLAALDAVSLK